MRINMKSIEKIFAKIDENFTSRDYKEKRSILQELENKATIYNGEQVSELYAIHVALDNIKNYFSRIHSEGKSKKSLKIIEKYIFGLENDINNLNLYKEEYMYKMIKYKITCLEIMLNLEINFYESLFDIYEECVMKEKEGRNYVKERQGRNKR